MQDHKPSGGLHELSLLATLIKTNASKASNFKLNLFGDSTQPAQASAGESCLTNFARLLRYGVNVLILDGTPVLVCHHLEVTLGITSGLPKC